MTLNRAARRRLRSGLRPTIARRSGRDFVVLRGGPMDGYGVRPDAPALRSDWSATWPPFLASTWRPGHYSEPAMSGDALAATWVSDGV